MRYDFETVVDRSGTGAFKWDDMGRKKPDLSPGIVPLSVADMEFKNAPEIVEGLKDFLDSHVLGYTGPTDAYYDAVCGWMREQHGWQVKPEEIVMTCGVVPAIYTAVRAFCQPGDGVLVLTPVYYPFYSAIEAHGCQVLRCPLLYRDGTYTIDFPLLEQLAARDDCKMLIFCSPHNPVGRVWLPEELRRVGDICAANGVRIVSDEIHADIIMPGHRHTVFSQAGDWGDQVIVCTAPSKTFNLAAMSTSNIVIPNPEDRERFKQANGMVGPSLLGWEACRIAYTRCAAWKDEMVRVIYENYLAAADFLRERLPMLRPIELQGTYLLWVDCTALGLSPQDLETLTVQKAELFLDEGYVFGPEGDGFERINLACPKRVLLAALERLEKAVKTLG